MTSALGQGCREEAPSGRGLLSSGASRGEPGFQGLSKWRSPATQGCLHSTALSGADPGVQPEPGVCA